MVAGVAGGSLLRRPTIAEAATGGPFTLGQANDAGLATSLRVTSGTAAFDPVLEILDLGASTAGLVFLAPLVGVGSSGHDGVEGYAPGTTAFGVLGASDTGFGIGGQSGSGVDVAASGTGRLQQLAYPTVTPSGPNFTPTAHEQVRDTAGVLWVSNADTTWRRVNSIVPMTPVRVLDTRNPGGVGTVGGPAVPGDVAGPIPANTVITLTLAGQVGIPASAIGIVGNLTSVYPSFNGFLTAYPADGTHGPNSSNVNFVNGGPPTPNAVVVGLGTGGFAGKVSIFVSNNPPGNLHVLLDVVGYIQ